MPRPTRRGGAHPERCGGLARAPVVLLAYSSADLYVARYAEPDKAGSGLGRTQRRWPVPYWIGDAAFGVMAVLLGAVDAGLGACILGAFRGEAELAAALGVPDGWRLFCAVRSAGPTGATTVHPRSTGPRPAAGVVAAPPAAAGE